MTISPVAAKSVLIASLGSEPQVVTSALDLLLEQGCLIARVVVLHTTSEQARLRDGLSRLQEAVQDYPGVEFQFYPILVYGLAQSDIETPLASEAAFQAVYQAIHQAKSDGMQVHLSIAGGRKNLAMFGMVAAQLLFDEEDRLWHLYSEGDFLESKRMHPTPTDHVHLLEIPVLLRGFISPVLGPLRNVSDARQALERFRRLALDERLARDRYFVENELTRAERRAVELLVCEGVGDLDIAARLHLSARTVERHLRAAYDKAAAYWQLEQVNRGQLIRLLTLYFELLNVEKMGDFPQDFLRLRR